MRAKNKTTRFIMLSVAILYAVFLNFVDDNYVFASVDTNWSNSVVEKTILMGMRRCYDMGKINSSSVSLADFSEFNQLIVSDSDNYVALPSGLTKTSDNMVSCTDLFLGGDNFEGLFELAGKSEYTESTRNPETKDEILTGTGYYDTGKMADKECMYFVYGPRNGEGDMQYTDNVCYKNGTVSVYETGGANNVNSSYTPKFTSHGNYVTVTGSDGASNPHDVYAYQGWDSFNSDLKTTVSTYYNNTGYWLQGNNGVVANDLGSGNYSPSSTWQNTATKFFSGSSYSFLGDLKLNDSEKLSYLINGLREWIYKDINVSEYQNCNISDSTMFGTYTTLNIDISSGQPSSTCAIDTSLARNDYIFGYDDSDYFDASGETKFYIDKIIEEINKLVEAGGTAEVISGGGDSRADCLTSGGARNLGYIICNVLDMVGNATTEIYNNAVKPALEVQPSLFRSGESSGTYQAWEVFQNIANIAFIIMVLFVIFSQVTGVGIDNYGIKKIMPKLIIAAILINLSYIICQLCVDLSNIVGNGIQNLFDNIELNSGLSNLTLSGGSNGTIDLGTEIGVGLLTALAVGGAAIMIWAQPAIVLSLLVGALGVLISILFIFALLAARQAALVVLTVISPLAFACYMLPNTKKLFDKWVKLGEGLLLVYPICGLLIGGGDFVGRLLLNSGVAGEDFWSALIAMLASIVPIFFIPTVLKSSFAAFGKVGATLSGLGDRVRGGATGKARNSTAYKNAQERSAERNTRIRAGVDKNGNPLDVNKMSKLGIALRGGRRNIARSRAQYLKDQDAQNRADRLTTSNVGFEAAQIAQSKAMESEQLKDYMTYINSKTNNGENQEALNDLFAQYTTPGQENKFGALAVARIAGRRKDTASAFLQDHFANDTSKYSSDIRNALAKEIATGENSGNYRESSPFGFEYAAQINSGNPSAKGSNYSTWLGETATDESGNTSYKNVHQALNNYVTDSKQLVGLKGSSLKELHRLAKEGKMDATDVARISKLAQDTINNRGTTGVWDTTKAGVIEDLANLKLKAAPVRVKK